MITVNRYTDHGIETISGELYTHEGFQFCIGKCEGFVMAIELTSGAAIYLKHPKIEDFIAEKEQDHFKLAKERIKSLSKEQIRSSIDRFMEIYKNKYKFPVNERV